jgi:pimeloyl-ACP methyl ester carboxylesterase
MKNINGSVVLALLLSLAAHSSFAQSWGPLNLEELKAETQRRADRNAPPIGGVKPEDAREAMAQLKTLEPDDWAAAWGGIGDRYFARAKEIEKTDPKEARELYYKAWDNFNVGRWPTERNSPGKMKVYLKALDAFRNYGRLLDPPLETVRIPFEGKEIVAYLRLPAGVRPAPLVFGINGLDSRKEDVIARVDSYLRAGIGVFAIDMPGTGEAPLLIDVGSERMFSRALDYLQTRQDIDAKRIVVQGRSWSGYWAALMAYTEKDRIRGAVVQGVGVHDYYSAEWQKKAFSSREYLFDMFPARAAVYGTKTMEEFLAFGPRLSLQARGFLDKPSAPMLLVNGERDTQQPISDLYLMMKHGDPKDTWVNPAGGHMGRSANWSSGAIADRVVRPWIFRTLGVAAAPEKK